MRTQKKSISQITGLRGVVAFLIAYILHWVLLYWAIPDFGNEMIETAFGSSATIILYSPNIFFIVSGYLMHQIYKERISVDNMEFLDFIIPKMKKMYPIVIFTAAITWCLQNLSKHLWGIYALHEDGGDVRNSLLSLLFSVMGIQSGVFSDNDNLSVNGPAWFVAILFICYILYFVITKFIKKSLLKSVLYVIFMLFGLFIIYKNPNMPFMYMVNGRGYFCFFLGVLMKDLVNLFESEEGNQYVQMCFKILIHIVAVVCFGYSFYMCCISKEGTEIDIMILTILFWPSLVYLVIHGFLLRWIFSFPLFVWLGKISMPIFLCNFPTDLAIRMCDLWFGWNLDYTDAKLWFVHIIISIMIAIIFHLIFEVSWKKKQ